MHSLLTTAVIVSFEFAIVQTHDRWSDADETINGNMDEESKIRDNFRRFLDSIGKNDVRKTKTFRTILEQESANGQQAFDSMKEELQVARQKKVNRQRNLSIWNGNVGQNGVPSKREIPDENRGSANMRHNGKNDVGLEGSALASGLREPPFWSNKTNTDELKRRFSELQDENAMLENMVVEMFGEVDFPSDRQARMDLLKEIFEVAFDLDKREPFVPEKFSIYYLFLGKTPLYRGIHPVVVAYIGEPFTLPDNKTIVRWIQTLPMQSADEWRDSYLKDTEVCRLSLEVFGNTTFVMYDLMQTFNSAALLYKYARKYGSFGSLTDHPPCLEKATTYRKNFMDKICSSLSRMGNDLPK